MCPLCTYGKEAVTVIGDGNGNLNARKHNSIYNLLNNIDIIIRAVSLLH